MRTSVVTLLALTTAALLVPLLSLSVDAADLNNRQIKPDSPQPGATTDYVVEFDIVTGGTIGSIQIEFCRNSPFPGDVCNIPIGFDASSVVLTNQAGVATGFNIDNFNSTSSSILLTRTPSASSPGFATFTFSTITSPTEPTGTYFARLLTFSSTDGSGAAIDDGGVALTTGKDITVSTYVPPYLEFCVGTTISSQSCSTATGSLINLGNLSATTPRSGTSQFLVATNAPGGYTVQVLGRTLSAGNRTIPASTSPTASSPGTSQFGLNLRANTSPSVGSDATGPGTAAPSTRYNTPNLFTFANGDTVAQSLVSSDRVTFTASYIANISSAQASGKYNTTLTYLATASF